MQTTHTDKQTDHSSPGASIPMLNRLFVFTAKTVWKGFKGLFHIAIRLPGLFAAVNTTQRNKEAKERNAQNNKTA